MKIIIILDGLQIRDIYAESEDVQVEIYQRGYPPFVLGQLAETEGMCPLTVETIDETTEIWSF
jgi:hypothetical protein